MKWMDTRSWVEIVMLWMRVQEIELAWWKRVHLPKLENKIQMIKSSQEVELSR